jgi:hypothetical protein
VGKTDRAGAGGAAREELTMLGRQATYGPRDQAPLLDDQQGGDVAFAGVDMRTDPGLLAPGVCSAAVNKTFVGGEARTRLGLFELANQNAGATVAGAALFSNPNGYEAILAATSAAVKIVRDSAIVSTVALPTSETNPADVTLVQCFDQVLLFRGEDQVPLRWNGDTGSSFEEIAQTVSGTGTQVIPNASFATAMANRLFVPRRIGDRLDCIAVSDALDYTRYVAQLQTFRINFGTSDDIVQLAPYGASSLVVFKGGSVAYLVNVTGDLSLVAAGEATREVGLVARNAVSQVGGKLWFLGQGGVWELVRTGSDEERFTVAERPVSWPMQPFFSRVNWSAAAIACSAIDDERYYLAVPIDSATRNNAVVVYNFVTGAWEGYHTFAPTVDLRWWIKARYLGQRRMWVIDRTGRAYVYNEYLGADYVATTANAIADSLTTRGYHRAAARRRFLRWQVQVATWRPTTRITLATDGINETVTAIAAYTTTRTTFLAGNTAAYALTNSADNHDAAWRDDYSFDTGDALVPRSGATPELHAGRTLRGAARQRGHYLTVTIANTAGSCRVTGVAIEAAEAQRATNYYA